MQLGGSNHKLSIIESTSITMPATGIAMFGTTITDGKNPEKKNRVKSNTSPI